MNCHANILLFNCWALLPVTCPWDSWWGFSHLEYPLPLLINWNPVPLCGHISSTFTWTFVHACTFTFAFLWMHTCVCPDVCVFTLGKFFINQRAVLKPGHVCPVTQTLPVCCHGYRGQSRFSGLTPGITFPGLNNQACAPVSVKWTKLHPTS